MNATFNLHGDPYCSVIWLLFLYSYSHFLPQSKRLILEVFVLQRSVLGVRLLITMQYWSKICITPPELELECCIQMHFSRTKHFTACRSGEIVKIAEVRSTFSIRKQFFDMLLGLIVKIKYMVV